MLFVKEEKVFSLSGTAAAVPFGDPKSLFEEFYCYLFVALLLREGEGVNGVHWENTTISDDGFILNGGCYSSGIARMITKGLVIRHKLLSNRADLTDRERNLLRNLNGIFLPKASYYQTLTGKDIFGVAVGRQFSTDMLVIAKYLSVMIGQRDYPSPTDVPRIYLSIFGNIHLAKRKEYSETAFPEDTVTLNHPTLRYGQVMANGDNVTGLWSMLSSIASSFTKVVYPGHVLGDVLGSFSLLGQSDEFEKSIPVPRFASSLYIKTLMGMDKGNPINVSTLFYQNFLYGTTETVTVSRASLLAVIFDTMMEKMEQAHLDHLFSDNSRYRRLVNTQTLRGKSSKRSPILQFALEKLDSDLPEQGESFDPTETTDSSDIDQTSSDTGFDPTVSMEDPESDPQTDDGGYDPGAPPAATPVGVEDTDKNTIDLISFDKSGEGVTEDLYRDAVVALNDKLKLDETLPVTPEARETLDYWVGGFLYRAAVSETKNLMSSLKLQKHLKQFNTK